MSNELSRYLICAVISVPLYFLIVFIRKQSKGVRIILFAVLMVLMVTFVTVFAYSQMNDSERAYYKTELAQKLPHYKYYDTPEQCLEETGFGKAVLVYQSEGEETLDALFLSDYGATYKVNFKTKDKKGVEKYCIDKIKIDKNESTYYGNSYYRNLTKEIDYIWVSVNGNVAKMDFGGYMPEIINAEAVVDGIKRTYHFYIFDKSTEPAADYNYAPICSLIDDPDEAYRAMEICDIIMNMDLNTDIYSFADKTGASDVKKLPATIADTYEYQIDGSFRLRSHGMPYEKFVFSTEYNMVTINMSDKSITAGYS